MKLNALFSDHVVLQRGMDVPVWGWTRPGLKVVGEIAGIKTQTLSNASGYFILRFPELPCGGPYTLKIKTTVPEESVVVNDVLVGEVWLCSGQSNMEFEVDRAYPKPVNPDVHNIRTFNVPRQCGSGPVYDVSACWREADSQWLPVFSAVGYFMAERLHEELGVPVGIVNSSWGGTIIEAWTSREGLSELPFMRERILNYERSLSDEELWKSASPNYVSGSIFPLDPGASGISEGWHRADYDDSAWPEASLPGTFAECIGRQFNGSVWFRKTVEIPQRWAGRALKISLGGADKHDQTFFNGVKVGGLGSGVEQEYWSVNRQYTISPELVKSGSSVVACRVWSFIFDGGLRGPSSRMFLCPVDDESDVIRLDGMWRCLVEHDIGITPPPPQLPAVPGNPNSLYTLFDSMIRPLVPFALRGVAWYQGESNGNERAAEYSVLHEAMIRDWRRTWGQGDFPFIIVQIANFQVPLDYEEGSAWAVIRDEQLKTVKRCNNCGMASAIDVGEEEDIHPKDKRSVGRRLAQWALAKVYGIDVVPNGPYYKCFNIEGACVRIHFTDIGSGLTMRPGTAKLNSFMIAGENQKFVRAEAVIDGDTVVVRADGIDKPMAVRYAWSQNPASANLYNREGLPASPFRTDCW